MVDHHANNAVLHGPFRRLEAPKGQTAHAAVLQALSGEVWGEVPRYGISATVEAYPGCLAPGESGIEFWTFRRPDTRYGPRPRWYLPGDALRVEVRDGREVAMLRVAFVRITQELLLEVSAWPR